MNTNDLRKTIDKAIKKENRTHKLFDLLAQTIKHEEREACFNFMVAYILKAPDFLDEAYSVAQSNGVLPLFQPVFDAVFSYWGEKYDFIPDNQGLIGLCDDAYLSLSLIQQISESKVPNTNVPLLNLDLHHPNNIMRSLIGEPVASQLDNAVSEVIQSTIMQNTLVNLFNHPALQSGMSLDGWDSELSNYQIDREVDTRLGAMGIF